MLIGRIQHMGSREKHYHHSGSVHHRSLDNVTSGAYGAEEEGLDFRIAILCPFCCFLSSRKVSCLSLFWLKQTIARLPEWIEKPI